MSEDGLVEIDTLRELALQAEAHGGREVELVHGEVDFPELHVGFLEDTAAELSGIVNNLLADAEGFAVLELGLVLQAKLLVLRANVRQGTGGLELGL